MNVQYNAYASFKYGQCLRNDHDFQKKVMYEERFNKSFGEDAQDVFQMLYQNDIKFIGESHIKTLFEQIKDTADFKSLKVRTIGKHIQSFNAMKNMIEQLKNIKMSIPQKPDQKQKDKIRQKMRAVIKQVTSQTEDIDDVLESLDFKRESGIESNEDVKSALSVASKLATMDTFKAIMLMMGRMQRAADSTIKTNCDHGIDELVGVTIGDDLSNVLPEEMAMPELFTLKYVESKLLINKFKGKVDQESGPIIVCIDESSSMTGFNYHFSRSILFAIYLIAVQQQRPMFVNRFASEVASTEIKSMQDILPLLDKFMKGGTDFNLALEESFKQIETNSTFTKADVIFITDGMDAISSGNMAKIKQKKSAIALKIVALMLGRGYITCLKQFCDHVYHIKDEDGATDLFHDMTC